MLSLEIKAPLDFSSLMPKLPFMDLKVKFKKKAIWCGYSQKVRLYKTSMWVVKGLWWRALSILRWIH